MSEKAYDTSEIEEQVYEDDCHVDMKENKEQNMQDNEQTVNANSNLSNIIENIIEEYLDDENQDEKKENEDIIEEQNSYIESENVNLSSHSIQEDVSKSIARPKKSKKTDKESRKKKEENINKYFFKKNNTAYNPTANNNEELEILPKENENLFGYSKLKKLKKKSELEKEKKINKHLSMGFFDIEAELGSDNEDHDDIVKNIIDDEEDENLDGDVKDLIRDDANEEEEGDLLKKKFFDDMLDRDQSEVKRVIDGPLNAPQLNVKQSRSENVNENIFDYMPMGMRMKKHKGGDTTDPQFNLNSLFNNIKSIEKRISENAEDDPNEELKEIYQTLEIKMVKKIAEKEKDHRKDLINRMKENDKILENVIILNRDLNTSTNNENNKNRFFIKGIGISNDKIVTKGNKLDENVNKPIQKNNKIGSFYNKKNSFLHAMKNDKYYVKSEETNNNPDVNLSQNSGDGSINTSSGLAGAASQPKSYHMFANKVNIIGNMNTNSNKSSNLTALFARSNKARHNESMPISRQVNESNNITPVKDKRVKKLLNSG